MAQLNSLIVTGSSKFINDVSMASNVSVTNIPGFSGNPPYLLGIEAFASGGAVKYRGINDVAVGTARKLADATIRPASATTQVADGGLHYYLSSGSMTTAKPPYGDGKILHMAWDNAGGYDSQLYISHGAANHAAVRSQNNGTWSSWMPVGVFTQATPTSGQVVISDGTYGGIKASGYTIAKSVPSNAVFTDTHRPIQVNGTEILGNNTTALNLKAGSNVTITNSSGTVTIAATDTKYTAATAAPGNVASASAVGTSTNYARQDHTHGISLATGDNFGQVKIAGTNVAIKGAGTPAYYGSNDDAINGWYKVCTKSLSGFSDDVITFLMMSGYNRQAAGIFHLHIRCENGTALSVASFKWLSRFGFNNKDLIVTTGDNTWSLYVNQTNTRYGRIQIRVLSNCGTAGAGGEVNLVSNETKESATPSGTYISDGDGYLPLIGGTMTGSLACSTSGANIDWGNFHIYGGGTNAGIDSVLIGDDAYIGDCNVGGCFGIRPRADGGTTAGIRFYNNAKTLIGGIQSTNGTLQWIDSSGTGYNIYHAGNTHTHRINQITWPAPDNLTCTATANGQEWSIDLNPGTYTGTYWHVWSSKNSKSILQCYTDDNSVKIPSGPFTVSGGNVTINKSNPMLIFDNTKTDIPAGTNVNIIQVKYKNADNTLGLSVEPISIIGTNSSDGYNVPVRLGSTNGTTIVSAGESGPQFASKNSKYNDEILYLVADGSILLYKDTANDGTIGVGPLEAAGFSGTITNGRAVVTSGTRGQMTSSSIAISGDRIGVTQTSGTSGGISLYNGAADSDVLNYGIAFRKTSNLGVHGYVQGDWATYFTMDNGTNRGWVYRYKPNSANVASISAQGHAVFNGSVTVGGNTANTSGGRMEYNATNHCIDFIVT